MLWPPQGSGTTAAASPITITQTAHAATNSPSRVLGCILRYYQAANKEEASAQYHPGDRTLWLW